jgi:ketosteroid isomerase-like protein
MRNVLSILFLAIGSGLLLISCAASNDDAPAQAVQDYLTALVAKDADRLPTLVCGDWEEDALMELDSLQTVTARLDNATCTQIASDGDTTLVNCTGTLVTTYNDEDSELDLSTRTYQVIQQGGDWLVCGTR